MPQITSCYHTVARALLAGEVAAVPTETVYGLAGCLAQPTAIEKIFQLKQRPKDHPLIVHIGCKQPVESYASGIHAYARRLMAHFWPGPLTLIFNKKAAAVPSAVTGGHATVAIRQPQHPLVQSVLAELPTAIAAPSANLFGRLSPTTAQAVCVGLAQQSLWVLEGGRCERGIESTIIDVRNETCCYLRRPGSITEQQLHDVLKPCGIPVCRPEQPTIAVPGMHARHYSPGKPLTLIHTLDDYQQLCARGHRVYFIADTRFADSADVIMPSTCPNRYAYELYHQLALAEQTDCDRIAIAMPLDSDTPSWLAIRDKLTRASVPANDSFP